MPALNLTVCDRCGERSPDGGWDWGDARYYWIEDAGHPSAYYYLCPACNRKFGLFIRPKAKAADG